MIVAAAGALPPTAPARGAAAVRPGAVLVRLGDEGHLAQLADAVPGAAPAPVAGGAGLLSLTVPPGTEEDASRRLAALPGVAYAQPDHAVAAQALPSDPLYPEQWHLARIGMPRAWEVLGATAPITVAVLDTGIALAHPDLRDQLWTNPGEQAGNGIDDDGNGAVDDVHGWHFYQLYRDGVAHPRQDGDIADRNGHGTHVAGIIGAAGGNGIGGAGVAWVARLMAVRVLDDDAVGWESDVVLGLRYAVANGARVVNISLGLTRAGPALAEAIAAAERAGVVVVAAAGNSAGPPLYPAAYPTVISVGASGQDDRAAAFSARGARLDLLAPGVAILSTWSGRPYLTRSGTSMAAPQVAGAAALLRVLQPAGTPHEVRACLLRTATDLGAPGRDDASGWGRLDAGRALGTCPNRIYLPQVSRASPEGR